LQQNEAKPVHFIVPCGDKPDILWLLGIHDQLRVAKKSRSSSRFNFVFETAVLLCLTLLEDEIFFRVTISA
jgi:hypothetical protein